MSAYFLTLTYAPKKCPITRNGFMDLSKRDVQLFFKRLRKCHVVSGVSATTEPIRYYAVGEYGGKSSRPHYHIILFNAELELMIGKKYAHMVRCGIIPLDGYYPFTCAAWPNGHVTLGEVTNASVGYTMKYVSKPKRIPMHRNDDRQPEFSLMSKRLGKNYLSEDVIKWHKADLLNRMHLTVEDGKKIAMPRYYKDKMYNDAERSQIAGFQKGEIERRTIEMVSDEFSKGEESYKNWLHGQKEAVKHSYTLMYKNAEKGRDKI